MHNRGANHRGAPREKPRVKNWFNTVKKIWKYLAFYRATLILVLIMIVFSSLLGLLAPYLVHLVIDDYIGMELNDGFLLLLTILAVVFLLTSLSIWLQNYWMIGIAQKSVFTMRTDLFRHLHRLPIQFYDHRQHGELMSRITNDIQNVSNTLNSSFIQIVSSLLTLIGTIVFMLVLSPILTLITLAVIPLMYYGMKWITKRTSKYFKETQRNLGVMNGFIEETISGQKVVKMFSQEKRMITQFMEHNESLRESAYWAQVYSGFIPKLMNVLNNLSFAIICGAGGLLSFYTTERYPEGIVTIGVIVAFTAYSRQFTRPLNDLANQFNTLLSAVAGAERVFEILDQEEEELDERDAIEIDSIAGNVTFDQVIFSYEKDVQTIKELNFQVSAGETIALVGPTGAGKTTILNLISRFYTAQEGQIMVDGQSITKIKRSSLRKHIGFVLQDPFLFEGSIKENIRYGRLEATDEEVVQAAKMANAHSFIMNLSKKYDTLLTYDGSGISQGQKQLISIARAILVNPSIFILDEATSSIDTITEMKIQEALYRLMEGRTSFVIAHRLNTIQKADQIFVIDDGQIIEKGSHEELLERKGHYYGLYHSQLKEEEII